MFKYYLLEEQQNIYGKGLLKLYIFFDCWCQQIALNKKCLHSAFFWPAFSCIWTEHGDLWNKSPYSVRIREDTDQKSQSKDTFDTALVSSFIFLISMYTRKTTISLKTIRRVKVIWNLKKGQIIMTSPSIKMFWKICIYDV